MVSSVLKNVPSPNKVSIVPRSSGALGFSQTIPEYEKKLYTKEDLISQMMVIMGGRAAEEIIFNKITNGASDDIDKINKLAYDIISKFGMGELVGLRQIDNDTKIILEKESNNLIDLVDDGLIHLSSIVMMKPKN